MSSRGSSGPCAVSCVLVALAVVLADEGGRALAQQGATFTAATELVAVQAVVRDKQGRLIRGLTRDDFRITEDGRPQELKTFAFVDLPTTATGPTERESAAFDASGIATNDISGERRVYVLVLDGMHVDATRSLAVRKLATAFIDASLSPNDLAAVLLIGNKAANQPFTSDRARLKASVAEFIGQKSQSSTLAIQRKSLELQSGGGKGQGITPEDAEMALKASQARTLYETIQRVCESLANGTVTRRSVVLFSEGVELDTTDLIGEDPRSPSAGTRGAPRYASLVLDAQRRMLEAARKAQVAISTIEPRGNSMGAEDMMSTDMVFDPQTKEFKQSASLGMMRELQRGQGVLRTLATETGGVAVVGTDRFTEGFARLVESNSTYYVLGYRPSRPGLDGEYHRIAVSVPSRGDVEVVARKGYATIAAVAGDASPEAPKGADNLGPEVRSMITGDLPTAGGLALRAIADAVDRRGDKTVVGLVLEIDTSTLQLAEKDGQLSDDIEVAFVALDNEGALLASNRSLGRLRLPAANRSVLNAGLRYVAEFPVGPGRYQVRAAVYETAGGQRGSVFADVTVPSGGVSLTTFLTSTSASAVPTSGTYPVLRAGLPSPPTTSRAFKGSETLTVLASVLGARAGHAHTVSVRLADEQGVAAFTGSASRLQPGANADGTLYSASVPLSAVKPGRYQLLIDASVEGAARSQSIAIVVR